MSQPINIKGLSSGAVLAPFHPTTLDEVKELARLAIQAGLAASASARRDRDNNRAPSEEEAQAKAVLAILQGLEIGIPAVQAVQGIAIINGKAMIFGDLLTAILWSKGFKVEKKIEGAGAIRCGYAKITRPDGTVIEKRFSVEDARRARLWDERPKVRRRDGRGEWYEADNDAPWYRFPDRMLEWRAFGFCVKDGASDVTRGMYVAEEMAPEFNEMVDITPQGAAGGGDLEIPDMSPRLDPQLADGSPVMGDEPQLSDKQWLTAFRHSAEMTRGIGLDEGFWAAHAEEISARGLEQECADIIAELSGQKPDIEADTSKDPEMLSGSENPAEVDAREPDKKPDISTEIDRRFAKFEKDLAMCPNPTRVRERRNAEQAYITVLPKPDQARFDAAFAQALARVKLAQAQMGRPAP